MRSLPLAQALAAAVAMEHQVIYGYGVAGAHLSAAGRAVALRELDAHRLRRDQLSALLGAGAPAAAAAYALPFAVHDDTTARSLCALLEDGCAGAAWDLVAAAPSSSTARDLGVSWLADSALAAARWRGPAGLPPEQALPGQPR